MSYDGSGNFTVPYTFTYDTVISETEMNAQFADIATGLSTAITKDGQTTITANIPFSNYKLTELQAGTAATDAANLGQVQAQAWKWCATAGGTADALTLSPTPAITAYAAGQSFRFIAGASPNTGAATVAVSGLAAKAIQNNGAALAAGDIAAGKMYEVTYDGTAFQLNKSFVGLTSSAIGVSVQGYDADTAKTDVKQSFTAQQRPLTAALTYNATQTWDCDAAQDATLTLTGNVTTFSAPTNQVAGSYYVLRLNVGTSPYSVTAWNSVFKFPAGTAPTLTATASAIDILTFRSDGTNMELVGISQDVK